LHARTSKQKLIPVIDSESRQTDDFLVWPTQYTIEAEELPSQLVRQLHLPKYDKLPATLLGRLARSKEFKGGGLGELLLMGALKRALEHSRSIALVEVVVDASSTDAMALSITACSCP
jgi:predicted GNAT family N-acyltransferase